MDIDVSIEGAVEENELTKATVQSFVRAVQTISSTEHGTVPLSRDMGVTGLPENNSPEALNKYAAEIVEQVGEWEDNIDVEEVTFGDNEAKVVLAYDGS